MNKKYGVKRPIFPAHLKDITKYATLPVPPIAKVAPNLNYPMDGNDQYGDCAMAGAAHAIQVWNSLTNRNDLVPTKMQIINEYFQLTGGQDDGLVLSKVLNVWHKTGLWNNKICGYAPFSVHNITALEQCVAYFGVAYCGIEMPSNGEDQFSAGQPWTIVSTPVNIVGGHCVPVIGYDTEWLYVVTWGKIQPVARDWFERYGLEAWAIVPQEAQEAGTMDGIDFASLFKDLASI